MRAPAARRRAALRVGDARGGRDKQPQLAAAMGATLRLLCDTLRAMRCAPTRAAAAPAHVRGLQAPPARRRLPARRLR